MKTKTQRLCIYPKDIMRVTGRSERFSRSLIQKIRAQLGKAEHQFVTIDEFCSYTGLQEEKVKEIIRD